MNLERKVTHFYTTTTQMCTLHLVRNDNMSHF